MKGLLKIFFSLLQFKLFRFDHNEVFCFCGFLRVFFVDVSKNRKETRQCWWWELHARPFEVFRLILLSRFGAFLKSRQEKGQNKLVSVNNNIFFFEILDSEQKWICMTNRGILWFDYILRYKMNWERKNMADAENATPFGVVPIKRLMISGNLTSFLSQLIKISEECFFKNVFILSFFFFRKILKRRKLENGH